VCHDRYSFFEFVCYLKLRIETIRHATGQAAKVAMRDRDAMKSEADRLSVAPDLPSATDIDRTPHDRGRIRSLFVALLISLPRDLRSTDDSGGPLFA
jgi:hypothetical protein